MCARALLRLGLPSQFLVGHFRAFFAMPEHVIGRTETADPPYRFSTASFQGGEARGGIMVRVSIGAHATSGGVRAVFMTSMKVVARQVFARTPPLRLRGHFITLRCVVRL